MAVRVHRARFRCMRRTAHAVFYKSGGALSPGRGGGLVASSPATKRLLAGDAAVQRSRFQVLRVLGSVAVVLGVSSLFFGVCSIFSL